MGLSGSGVVRDTNRSPDVEGVSASLLAAKLLIDIHKIARVSNRILLSLCGLRVLDVKNASKGFSKG